MITIKNLSNAYPLSALNIRDGEAYERDDGMIFIGNFIEDLVAFSLDGSELVRYNSVSRFRCVDLVVEVVG